MSNSCDSTCRFSNRVQNYVRYRPTYPVEVVELLQREIGLTAETVVADVGSGTGISAKLLLDYGNMVYGIEPNGPMRQAGESFLAGFSQFHSVGGTAETTTLPDRSVDLIVAGQAFHWFDRLASRQEFSRILRPGGWVVLMWNTRRTTTTPFLREYEALICEFAFDYRQVDHRNIDEAKIQEFFAPAMFQFLQFNNKQVLDLEGLAGRLASSSYMPAEDDPRHPAILNAVRELFERHQHEGVVEIEYDTELYLGQLS